MGRFAGWCGPIKVVHKPTARAPAISTSGVSPIIISSLGARPSQRMACSKMAGAGLPTTVAVLLLQYSTKALNAPAPGKTPSSWGKWRSSLAATISAPFSASRQMRVSLSYVILLSALIATKSAFSSTDCRPASSNSSMVPCSPNTSTRALALRAAMYSPSTRDAENIWAGTTCSKPNR